MISTRLCQAITPRILRQNFCCAVSQNDYEKAADESLERLSTYLDALADRLPVPPEYDVSHAMGVLTVVISKEIGTYVINKQTPNRQLWLSSPVSGPKRYDLVNDRWIYTHDNEALDSLLTREFRSIFVTEDIDFRGHI
ncbi:Frataxin, mitochondrial [Parelaphostrongylus tenuis]|uniref:ferroxidase n=1 Tax=Parelaphostrongylus tenuis TaxID=148309 RepID=A0AAD5R345_PARTN|nr:Frataxin, mitochondrial [Parelaphostrongylus tenuis]